MLVKNDMPKVKGNSIRTRIACALLALVLVQGLILLCSITLTGAIGKINVATYNILSNQSSSRKNDMQEILNSKRKSITNTSLELNREIERTLVNNDITMNTLVSGGSVCEEILTLSLAKLISFTKYNAVTGVFVVFDQTPDIVNEAKTSRVSLYLRDSSPGAVIGNNSNLLLEYGYVNIARREGVAVDYLWTRDISFSGEYGRDFYFKPIKAALEADHDPKSPQHYGYWSPPFKLKKDSVPVITYSLPLILDDGTVYGVIGFELDTIFVSNLMKATDIPYDNGFYLLGADVGDGLFNDSMIFSGSYANQFLSGSRAKLSYTPVYESGKSPIYEIISSNSKMKAIGAYSEIGLYETFSPFYNDKWALLCIGPKASVMSSPNSVRNSIFISIISTVVLASVLSIFIMFFIANPINRLSGRIRSIDPEKPVRFEKTSIREIDELSGAFEILSDHVSEAAAKMFKIIELVDMPLGSFEVDHQDKTVQLSELLFDLLNMEKPVDGSHVVPVDVWNAAFMTLERGCLIKSEEGITEILYETDRSWHTKKWFRVRMITENTRDIGILTDVTDEIVQKQKLEYESSYDPLTKLLNRSAFMGKAAELMRSKPDDAALMMFADLDDLKFVNDMYGHETGDEYIKAFSTFLTRFKEVGAVTGRISGDEFVLFMSGFSSRQEAKKTFDGMISGLKDMTIPVSDGVPHKLRVSIGLSYYPSDSRDIEELVKYADYAMYEIKHSIKGEVREFNIGDYNKNSFVLKMKDMLNRLIDEKRISLAFQPIIDVKTGEVFAYEALMRSMMRELKSPFEILRIARSQSKLYQIEKLTFDTALGWLKMSKEKLAGKKMFINSIPGQIFLENDVKEMREKFSDLSGQVVFEITENEFSNTDDTRKKVDILRDFGAMIAIDDYGSGYSNELALLSIGPDFLKIDMSIVRDIDKDSDKQQLVQGTIAYSSQRNIRIIAEGVETHEELSTLVKLGVDYIQGFYLARPSPEILDIPEELKNELLEITSSQ